MTLPVLASLLKVYSQAKLWDKACGIYKELKNAGARFQGLVFVDPFWIAVLSTFVSDVLVDTATYGALIKAGEEKLVCAYCADCTINVNT